MLDVEIPLEQLTVSFNQNGEACCCGEEETSTHTQTHTFTHHTLTGTPYTYTQCC